MKKYKYLSHIFAVLAVLLSDVMCAGVTLEYCKMRWSAQYAAGSAPAEVAFLLVIPYGVGIAVCVTLALIFRKRHLKSL